MSIYTDLGLNEETVAAVEDQAIGGSFEVLPSGAYKATIKSLCTFTTKSGAGMLQAIIAISDKDRDITVYQNIVKKDGNPNAIGQATFKYILESTGVDTGSLTTAVEKMKTYSYESDCKVVKGIAGKPIVALVRAVHEAGADYEDTNEIEGYVNNMEDANVEAFLAKIAKKPVLERKSKVAKAPSAPASQAVAESIDDLV